MVETSVVETVVVELLPRLRLKTDVIDELNEPEFGLFIKEVTWSYDKLATWLNERAFTVAAGMLVHALVVTEPMLSVDIKAMSVVLIPALYKKMF